MQTGSTANLHIYDVKDHVYGVSDIAYPRFSGGTKYELIHIIRLEGPAKGTKK